jgi:prephenate dehydrogenase/chorismate mutase/prephenate dehydrogenase
LKILVVGNRGNFGKTAVDYLRSMDHEVSGVDKNDELPKSLDNYDAFLLAIPIRETIHFLENHDQENLIEICSVKEPLKKFSQRIISIHPMFGPNSINDPEFRHIFFINDISSPDKLDFVKNLFPGFFVHSVTADEHDRFMIDLLVRPYIFSMIAQKTDEPIESRITTSSYDKLRVLQSISLKESEGVIHDTIAYNPYSMESLKKIREQVEAMFNAFT